MMIEDLLARRGMMKYRLAVLSGVPHATLNDICSGKTKLEKCSAETVYKLAKTLNVPMELLTEEGIHQSQREQAYEYGLPEYLQHDLDAYKEGMKNHSSLLDCLWGELYGSINMAQISDGVITPGTRRLPAEEIHIWRQTMIDFTDCRIIPGPRL